MGSAELILIAGLFAAAFAVYSLVSGLIGNNADKNLLSWASGKEPVKSVSPLINLSRPLVHQFTLQHALKIKSPSYRAGVARLIKTSGLSREINVDEFIGFQILWGVIFPLMVGIANFSLQIGLPWLIVFLIIPVGAYGPRLYANRCKRSREAAVRADLPFFADLLALSTEAGLEFMSAIQRIVDKAESSVLAEELGQVIQDIKLGSNRTDALREMAQRLDMNEITSFVAVIIDSTTSGSSISQVLKDQSEQIRLERFVRAEKAGARASQTILLPIVIFIVPAVFLVVFGPVALQFIYGGK